MATNLRPVPPPLDTKMVDDNGIVTPVWANFFETIYRYQKNMADSVADGTYTLGTGVTDGEITITSGVITTVQEVT